MVAKSDGPLLPSPTKLLSSLRSLTGMFARPVPTPSASCAVINSALSDHCSSCHSSRATYAARVSAGSG